MSDARPAQDPEGTAVPGPGPVRVALLQMTCALGERTVNLARADESLGRLLDGVALACLPETFDLGYDLDGLGDAWFELAETVPGPTTEHLARRARELGVAIVAGVTERDARVPEVLYDAAVAIDARGRLVGHYRKTHLYPAEHRVFRPGDALPVFEVAGVRVGIAICFEHAFPPVFSTLARRGAQLVVNPSAVPAGYAYLQDLRTRARAQDNQVFVAAVNHVGREGNVTFCGGCQVADPRGEILARAAPDGEDVIVADLDLGEIPRQRLQEPVFRTFRPELYEF